MVGAKGLFFGASMDRGDHRGRRGRRGGSGAGAARAIRSAAGRARADARGGVAKRKIQDGPSPRRAVARGEGGADEGARRGARVLRDEGPPPARRHPGRFQARGRDEDVFIGEERQRRKPLGEEEATASKGGDRRGLLSHRRGMPRGPMRRADASAAPGRGTRGRHRRGRGVGRRRRKGRGPRRHTPRRHPVPRSRGGATTTTTTTNAGPPPPHRLRPHRLRRPASTRWS